MSIEKYKFHHKEFDEEFGLHKYTLGIAGTWPLCPKGLSYVLFVIALTTQVFGALMLANELRLNCGPFDWFLDVSLFFLFYLLSIVKTVTVKDNRKMGSSMLRSSHEDWVAEDTSEYGQVQRKYLKIGRMFFFAILLNVASMWITIIIMPVISGKVFAKQEEVYFPLGTICTFDEVGKGSYLGIYVFEAIQLMYGGIGAFSHDAYIISLLLHTCGQLEVLGMKFQKLDQTSETRALVRRFAHLQNHVKTLEGRFMALFLIQLLENGVLLCEIGIYLLISLHNKQMTMIEKYVEYFTAQTLQLFMYCWMGQYVENKMTSMTDAIYFGKWYLMGCDHQKNIVFVMMYAGLRTCIKVGKTIPLNLGIFATIIKKLVSALSIFRATLV